MYVCNSYQESRHDSCWETGYNYILIIKYEFTVAALKKLQVSFQITNGLKTNFLTMNLGVNWYYT
jgi:hypothetical protein